MLASCVFHYNASFSGRLLLTLVSVVKPVVYYNTNFGISQLTLMFNANVFVPALPLYYIILDLVVLFVFGFFYASLFTTVFLNQHA